MPRLLIYGDGGFGREMLLPLGGLKPAGSDRLRGRRQRCARACGIPVIRLEEANVGDHVVLAVSNSRTREKLDGRCREAGLRPWTLIAPSAEPGRALEIGEGAILCGKTMLTGFAQIGRQFHCNVYSYVAHDCVIGDYVTFAPDVHCNGNVHVRDHAYIGTGAILKQGNPDKPLVIGEGAIIGMGAVVTRDVAPFTMVVGNPARPLARDAPRVARG